MISITAQYLINVIERHINSSIAIRRQRIPEEFRAASATPTNEELADFILSIPVSYTHLDVYKRQIGSCSSSLHNT